MNDLLQPVVDSVHSLTTDGVPIIIELPIGTSLKLAFAFCLIILFYFLARTAFAKL